MMPAAKHGDPQLGVDIHLCTVPPGVPTPLPTPHMSIVFGPFDYVPILGATVSVCGMKRATAGTNATVIHIPPGFPFAPKLPDKDDELFMGSSTVVADGDPFSFVAVPVLGCQVAGMPSIPRLKKKGGPKAMLLPTDVNVAIPTNVVIGGPPTISLMGMAFKGLFSALGKFAKSAIFKRMRQGLFKNLNPGFLKCTILRAEPVNILTGAVSVEQQDFTLPGRIPIQWVRSYSSGNQRDGWCGHGWETPADIRLEVDASNGSVLMMHPSIGPLCFERLPAAPGDAAAELELMDGALLSDHGGEFRVRTKQDRIYSFSKALTRVNEAGAAEYAITRIADLCGNWLEFERRGTGLIGINDSAGRRIELLSENGRITEIALSLPDTETRQVFVHYQYDVAGDLVSVIDALGQPYTFAYDAHHLRRHTDRNGLSFHYSYEQSTDGEWRVTHAWGDGGLYDYRFEYIDAINERRITDSLGHVSLVKLDERGLPINEIDPLGGMTLYEYDDAGRTTAVVDPDRHRTEYEYDERGNLLALTRPDGKTLATAFSSFNKAIRITDPNGATWQQAWDARGLLTQQITPLGAASGYDYDALDQAIRVQAEGHAPIELSRNALGQLTRETLSAGVQRRHDYSPDGYLTAQRVSAAAGPVFEQHYRYDRVGNLIEKQDSAFGNDQYTYDPLGRLTAHLDPQGRLTHYLNDPAGDRLRTRVREPDHDADWHREGEYDGSYYRYDRAGNLTERHGPEGDMQLVWDANQRLIESTTNGKTTTYHYDPLGRRLRKQTGDTTTHFCWDGDALLGDASVVDIKDTGPTLRRVREWVYYPETFEPLALVQSYGTAPTEAAIPPELYLYHNDPNGCPTRLLDTTGKVVWAAQYSAWGGVERVLVNRVDNPIRLQGQYEDGETGLYYNRHRYYESHTGQYIHGDPIGLRGGLNIYGFGPNSLNWADPLGLSCTAITHVEDQYEHFYRAMSKSDFEDFLKTGRLPATSETFISPTRKFSEGYQGVLVKFQVASGTTDTLRGIGVRSHGAKSAALLSDLPQVKSGWGKNKALFKPEGDQINIGLGKGKALDVFNDSIKGFEVLGVN